MKKNDEGEVTHVFVSPGYSNEALKYVLPVLLIDVCHRVERWKGFMFFVTAMSPCHELYPICFGITSDPESASTWHYILTHLKWACPIVRSPDDMVFSDSDEEDHESNAEEQNHDNEGSQRSSVSSSLHEPPMRDFVIVSDHDKGLKEAVQSVLPHMHATSSAVHVKRNVQKVYGQRAAANVIRLAKTFSLMESEQSYRRLSR